MTTKTVSRIGPKGQLVLKKKLRDKIGLKEGMLIEEELTKDGILIKPIEVEIMLKEIEEVAKKVSEKWPRELDAVEAVRRERR